MRDLSKAPKEAVDPGFVSFSSFREACPDLFLSRALPAAGCDSKLSLGSGVQSSELSRQSLAYPGPTEINLAWSVLSGNQTVQESLADQETGKTPQVRIEPAICPSSHEAQC